MTRLKNVQDLIYLRETLQQNFQKKQAQETTIYIGMGTCGLAAGAGDTYQAIVKELEKQNLKVTIQSVGCIGICVKEPLVDVQLPGKPRVTYANVKPAQVPKIIEEHIINGRVVQEWAIGFIPSDW
jgi:NADP-reducing hydrogenase subunit HndB